MRGALQPGSSGAPGPPAFGEGLGFLAPAGGRLQGSLVTKPSLKLPLWAYPRFNRDLKGIIEDMGLPVYTPAASVHSKLQETRQLYEVKEALWIFLAFLFAQGLDGKIYSHLGPSSHPGLTLSVVGAI